MYKIKSSIVFQVMAIICLLVTFIAGWNTKTALTVCSFLAFIFCLFYSALDKFVRIKATATGFEAETRKVIQEAETTIKELQSFGKNSIMIFISLVKRMGRIGPYTAEEEQAIEVKMKDILKNLKFTDDEIHNFIKESEWFNITCFDYANKILSKVNATSLNESQRTALKELRKFRLENIPSPDTIKKFIDNHGLISKEIEEWINKGWYVYSGDVKDKFGPYGITILAIFEPLNKNKIRLVTYLMSCRVMGRGVEQSFFRSIAEELSRHKFTHIEASFVPTKKNMPAAEFLPSLSATQLSLAKSGAIEYELTLKEYIVKVMSDSSYIKIIDNGNIFL